VSEWVEFNAPPDTIQVISEVGKIVISVPNCYNNIIFRRAHQPSLAVFLNASGPRLPSSYKTFTFPTCEVVEDFAFPAATASSSLRFTAPMLAAEHFLFLPPGVELPATGGYVGTVSGDLPHSTQNVLFTASYPDIRIIWHFWQCL